MNFPSQILRAVSEPKAAVRELHRQYYRRGGKHDYNPNGINIFDTDWDNLIILDACRFDIFAEVIRNHDIEGTLESRTSRGSATYEFISANFRDQELHDVAYITANSWYSKLSDELDSEIFKLIDIGTIDTPDEYTIPKLELAHPALVTDEAQEAADKYPHKRLLIHYLRPHHPFIGEFGRKKFPYVSTSLREVINKSNNTDRETLRKAYYENLNIVLNEVERLLNSLTGKTIITADHGELLGDRYPIIPVRGYGHPKGIYKKELVCVPWFIIDDGNRRKIIADPPEESVIPESVDKQLKSLGYKI